MKKHQFQEEEFTQVFVDNRGNIVIQSINSIGEESHIVFRSRARSEQVANAVLLLAMEASFNGEEEEE